MTEIYETQSERTDLPLVVMPSVLDSMIEPIKAQFPALHDVARVRMFEEFTSDEATIAERLKDADALLVGGYHISDDLLRTISGQGHVKCIVFCGTGVASYRAEDPRLQRRTLWRSRRGRAHLRPSVRAHPPRWPTR